MSTAPDQAPHEAALFRTIREWGITRGDNGVIGGVAEGLGDRIGMARVPARIIMVVAAIPLTALVFLAYAAAWALLPDRKGNIIVQNFGRGIPNVGALIGIAVLTLFGLGNFGNGTGIVFNSGAWGGNIPWNDVPNWGGGHVVILILAILVPLVIIAGVITAIVLLVKKSGNGHTSGPGAVYAAPPAPTHTPPHTTSPSSAAAATADAGLASPPLSPAPASVSVSAEASPAARQWAPAPPAPPAPPRRPRVPGPGRAFYLLTLSSAAIAAAAAAWLERDDRLGVHPVIAAAVLFVIGLGLILIAVSLSGRKLGFLGFVGIASLVPLLIFAGNAESLRAAYAENGGITHYVDAVLDPSPMIADSAPFDATLTFGRAYANVYFNASCYEANWEDYRDSYPFASVQRLNLEPAATARPAPTTAATPVPTPADTAVDITAELTYISIAKGASVTLDGDANALATVVFADRGFQCDFQPGSSSYMELTNSGAPTINLVVADDQYANTIVIQEVAS